MGLIIMIVGTYMPLYLKSTVQTLINYRHRQCLQMYSCRCTQLQSHAQLSARSLTVCESTNYTRCSPSAGRAALVWHYLPGVAAPGRWPRKVIKETTCAPCVPVNTSPAQRDCSSECPSGCWGTGFLHTSLLTSPRLKGGWW